MATYSLSGSGIQALTADTTALHVSITTLSPFGGIGNANPPNHYHQALLRPGDGTGYWAPIPVEGGPEWFGLPNGTDRIGYACEGGAVISVVEVIGGTSPFAGPPGSPGAAGPAGPPGAGGAATQTWLGHNAIGASSAAITGPVAYHKKITPGADAVLISVGAYVKGNGGNVADLSTVLYADNAGAPGIVVAANLSPPTSIYPPAANSARWLQVPLSYSLVSGTSYWIGVAMFRAAAALLLYYDTSGSDHYYVPGGAWVADGGAYTDNTTTNNYSIRALTLS